jgi:predicted outer membrane repeat protein
MRFAVMAFAVGLVPLPSQAATINVAPGEVLLSPGNGKCSLREAILNAEGGADFSGGDCVPGSAGNDTIALAANSIYVLPDRDPYPLDVLLNDRETSGLPEMHTQLTIDGNGATIQRDPAAGTCFRILYVSRLGNVSLNNMRLQNGCVNITDAAGEHGAGGAIFNRGTLSLDTVTISNNSALRSGGAIHNDGTLTLTRSTVRNNAVTAIPTGNAGAGGGIVNRGAMQVFQSTISANSTTGAGGAVDAGVVAAGGAGDGAGKATFANTTVSGNVSTGNGGGMFFSAAPLATVVNTTITNNSSDGLGGGGIWVNYGGSVTLTNSIVARQVRGEDCWFLSFGNMIGGGNNLDSDATCPSSTTVADPMIGSLANNGGPTLTHALLLGSPAIGTANNAIATAFPVSSVDQRGVPRPQGASSDIGAFEFLPLATTTSVATSGTPSALGGSVTFNATVTSGGATGSVSFYDGATPLGSAPLSGTTATFTTSALGVGGHSITAVYGGDANYATSASAPITQTVNPLPTTTSVATSGTPSTFGTSVTFTATVTSGATGNVTFKDGASTLGISALSGTTAAFTTSALSIGGHSITAVYGGETNYSGSTSPAITQTVNQAPTTTSVATSGTPSVYGTAVTFTATVTSGATGTVTFYDGVTPLGTGTLSVNTATLTTSALTAGPHTITAVYVGDTNYVSSTSPAITQTVSLASGGVAVGSSLNPSTYGDTVTFTASAATDATGSITFMDGVAALGNGTIVTGSATFATSSLGGGSHNITAVYAGDANHSAGTSPILTQVVNRAPTTTTFTSSAGPYFASLAVTFTATVSAGATGTVTFGDGATVLGTGTLVNGAATFTTAALNAGPHSITASYNGDPNFAPSVSGAAAILVSPAANIPTLSILMLMALAMLIVAVGAMRVGR